MDDLDSLRLALAAETHTHRKDNEHLIARAEAAETERDRLLEREKHFARALAVADGGEYRNDWDGAIRRVLAERDEARTALIETVDALERYVRRFDSPSISYEMRHHVAVILERTRAIVEAKQVPCA